MSLLGPLSTSAEGHGTNLAHYQPVEKNSPG
jgi:hypothetical protein